MEAIDFENTKFLSKWQFKKLVKGYISEMCRDELLEESKKYKKINHESLRREEFTRKQYFQELNLSQVRDRLRLRSQMFGDFRGSFPSKFRRQGITLKCKLCENVMSPSEVLNITSDENTETQTHFLELCPLVSDIKDMYNTNTDAGLIQFFRAVNERRAEID